MALLPRLRVLDLTDERGLIAGRVLADLGADVVQVEPLAGSSARRRVPRVPVTDPEAAEQSYVWEAFAANKRGLAVDLDSSEGADLLRRLATVADVLIENDGPVVQRPRGLDHDQLRAGNPGLVYVSITAFGRSGPKAGYAASDLVLWAAGGVLDEHRDGTRPPLRISLPQAYLHAGLDAADGALIALLGRVTSGRGQLVDVSVQACLGAATLGHVLTYAVGDIPRDMTEGHSLEARRVDESGSGSGTDPKLKKWPCADGLVEFHLGLGPAAGRFTNNFLAWMQSEGALPEEFDGLDFVTLPARIRAGDFTDDDTLRLRAAVGVFLIGRTKAQVLAAALEHKLLCVPIFDTADVFGSPQLAEREFFVTVGQGDRRRTLPGPFARVSERGALTLERPAPVLGEHTEEVVAEWLGEPAATGATEPTTGVEPVEVSSALPLAGLKVLDFSWVVAGPVVGRALADFGATVVRVESSTRIETARFMQPFQNAELGPENSALYSTWNAGKLGVTLDLQSDDGRQVARDLVAWADVVVESFSPGLMKRWGLDYATLAADRPDLIMLSTSINGQTGSLSRLAGYGNIGAALSGFQAIVGWPDGSPIGPFGPYTDYVGPRFSLAALLAALDHRRRTGRGAYLDVAQVEAGVWLQSPELADHADQGTRLERLGNADREFAPHGVYPTLSDEAPQEARYVAIAVTTDAQWAALADAIGRPDLAGDPTLAVAAGRHQRAVELDAAVADWTARHRGLDVEQKLQALGVPAHISSSSRDFCTDPQLAYRGHLVTVAHPLHGSTVVEGPRYLLSETPGRVRAAAPTFGQHNRQVLTELLGYSTAEVDRLGAAGILR